MARNTSRWLVNAGALVLEFGGSPNELVTPVGDRFAGGPRAVSRGDRTVPPPPRTGERPCPRLVLRPVETFPPRVEETADVPVDVLEVPGVPAVGVIAAKSK